MTMHHAALADVVRRDCRYAYEAYEFVFQALEHLEQQHQKAKGAPGAEAGPRHVRGPELLEGIRELALREFGLMARAVFHRWGIDRTDDFGEIVFRLVEANLMSKTNDDSRDDFRNVFDLDEALLHGYRIELEKAE